jgi:hypothetical protein
MKLTINIDISNHKAIALLNYIKTLDFINIEEKSEQDNIPKWQIKEVAKRLKKLEKNPEKAIDFEKTIESIEKKYGL